MKSIFLTTTFALVSSAAFAADAPKLLTEFLTPNAFVKGEVVVVVPPPEIDKYISKVSLAAKADPAWFAEHSKKAKPGVPLPYDEKLGLTQQEYAEYLKLWDQREFKPVEPTVLQLKEGKDNTWSVSATGNSSVISLLRYDPAAQEFKSANGPMKRLDDVNADAASTLRAWTGHEWKYEQANSLGSTKENIAFGKTADGKYGLIVYRMQEVSTAGTPLMDKGIVIRFLLGEAGLLKEKADAPAAGGGGVSEGTSPPKNPPSKAKKK